jgi:hypothetical protein
MSTQPIVDELSGASTVVDQPSPAGTETLTCARVVVQGDIPTRYCTDISFVLGDVRFTFGNRDDIGLVVDKTAGKITRREGEQAIVCGLFPYIPQERRTNHSLDALMLAFDLYRFATLYWPDATSQDEYQTFLGALRLEASSTQPLGPSTDSSLACAASNLADRKAVLRRGTKGTNVKQQKPIGVQEYLTALRKANRAITTQPAILAPQIQHARKFLMYTLRKPRDRDVQHPYHTLKRRYPLGMTVLGQDDTFTKTRENLMGKYDCATNNNELAMCETEYAHFVDGLALVGYTKGRLSQGPLLKWYNKGAVMGSCGAAFGGVLGYATFVALAALFPEKSGVGPVAAVLPLCTTVAGVYVSQQVQRDRTIEHRIGQLEQCASLVTIADNYCTKAVSV